MVGDLLVSRQDLRECRVAETPRPALEPGQALLRVDSFGMTANNVTYAVWGDAMSYWRFFPAPEGWGRLPVWGFAGVVESEAEVLRPGGRVFGFLPASHHLVVQPEGVSAAAFLNAAPHLRDLSSAYHGYLFTEHDPFYDARHEDLQVLLRPLFFTSFLIDDLLGGDHSGAGTLVLSSASSKTAIATAFLAARRKGLEVAGLTSARNVEFVRGLGVYDAVLPYEELESLEASSATFVDVAGDGELRARVHRHLEDRLESSLHLGATHWDRLAGGPGETPGPEPRFFFAPEQVMKRAADWGGEDLVRRVAEAWAPFAEWTAGWLEVSRSAGLEGAREAYLEVLAGGVPPDRAHVVEL